MSLISDEDDILKDMITKTLQNNGVLGKIQAQLRASVFLALDEEFKEKAMPLCSPKARELLSSPAGSIAASLIHDFFDCLGLDFSQAVFGPESGLSGGQWKLIPKSVLRQKLGCKDGIKDSKTPVLLAYCKTLGFSEDNQPHMQNSSDVINSTKKHLNKSPPENKIIPISKQKIAESNISKRVNSEVITSDKTTEFFSNAEKALSSKNESSSSSIISNLKSSINTDFNDKNTFNKDSAFNKQSSNNSAVTSNKDINIITTSKNEKFSAIKRTEIKENETLLPPSNILTQPPLDDDWEDSSESSSFHDNLSKRQRIKTLISEMDNERSNLKESVTDKDLTDSEYSSSSTVNHSQSNKESESQEATEETIHTEDEASFGDIISEGSQKSNETEDKSSAASNPPDFEEDL